MLMKIVNPDGSYQHNAGVAVDEYGVFHGSYYAQAGVTEVQVELAGNADYYGLTRKLLVPAGVPFGMGV